MLKSFYHYMMKYRGAGKKSEERVLADWMFQDHDFPKHSSSYEEISEYLEMNSPFPDALRLFDDLWERYETDEMK